MKKIILTLTLLLIICASFPLAVSANDTSEEENIRGIHRAYSFDTAESFTTGQRVPYNVRPLGAEIYFTVDVTKDSVYDFTVTPFAEGGNLPTHEIRFYNAERELVGSGEKISQAMIRGGTYYFVVSFPGLEQSNVFWLEIAEQEFSPTLADRIAAAVAGTDANFLMQLLGMAVSVAVGLVGFLLTFFPYARFMNQKYGYRVFGIPFVITMAGIVAAIVMPLFGFDPLNMAYGNIIMHDGRGRLILFGIVGGGIAVMSVVLALKARKHALFLVPINAVAMVAFFYFATQFVITAIFLLVGLTILVVVGGASVRIFGAPGGAGGMGNDAARKQRDFRELHEQYDQVGKGPADW
jgi:hypothetical protein